MQNGQSLEGCFQAIKLLSRRPRNWSQCVELARLKFEKYFNHKVGIHSETSVLGLFITTIPDLKCLLFSLTRPFTNK